MLQELQRKISNELTDTPTLQKLGFVVNIEFHLLICILCKSVVDPSHAASHLQGVHSLLASKFNKDQLKSAIDQFNLPSALPALGAITTIIAGLEVSECLACIGCSGAYANQESMRQHHRKDHPKIPIPESWQVVQVQQFDKGRNRSWFKVKPKSAAPSGPNLLPSIIVNSIQSQIDSLHLSSIYDPDIRNVTPWLRLSGWHKVIVGHKITDLRNYVALPGPNEFPGLHDAVTCLFEEKASPLFDSLSVLIRQRLLSPDPVKECVLIPQLFQWISNLYQQWHIQ